MSRSTNRYAGALLCLLATSSCQGQGAFTDDLATASDPVRLAYERTSVALTAAAPPTCSAGTCNDCNIDVEVGHIVFIHGYSSDKGAFSDYNAWIKDQNACAGYNTYRVSIGQKGGQTAGEYDQISCTPDAYDPSCIGHCTGALTDGRCTGYDRSKNGVCASNGKCVSYSSDGATKSLDTWAEDLASFFWNNKLTDLPDRSVTIVTHSTGGPAAADFMVRGYDNEAAFAIPARKVKKVITIQAALGGACGVSLADGFDDATTDLNKLQDDKINYDFRKATFDGAVPWFHVQSKGEVGLTGNECEGMNLWGGISTGDACGGTSHDGVVNNWVDSTSLRHPNGAADNAGTYPYNITVYSPEQNYCHTSGDDWPSYRGDLSRFRLRFGTAPVLVDQVRNPFMFQPWFPVVLGWRS